MPGTEGHQDGERLVALYQALANHIASLKQRSQLAGWEVSQEDSDRLAKLTHTLAVLDAKISLTEDQLQRKRALLEQSQADLETLRTTAAGALLDLRSDMRQNAKETKLVQAYKT